VYGIVNIRQIGFVALFYRVYDAVYMSSYFRTSKKFGTTIYSAAQGQGITGWWVDVH
jgi:hypothetical protein